MRVAWKRQDEFWFASIGPCRLMLRPMHWSDEHARMEPFRTATIEDRAWIYSIYHYPSPLDLEGRVNLAEGAFEVVRRFYDGGIREAQDRVVELTREFALCRRQRRAREAPSGEAVTWLEDLLLEILRRSYAEWHERVARYGRGVYPEPRWSTAQLAREAGQYGGRPDDLDVSEKRFYQAVYAALQRLRRRGFLASSTGADYQGRETRLWEPA